MSNAAAGEGMWNVCQTPAQAGRAGRGDDWPDAGRQAPGERGGGVDLGRPGAGAERVRQSACRRDRLPCGERRYDEAAGVGAPATTSNFSA